MDKGRNAKNQSGKKLNKTNKITSIKIVCIEVNEKGIFSSRNIINVSEIPIITIIIQRECIKILFREFEDNKNFVENFLFIFYSVLNW
jgi:hypothetical protein